MFYIKFGAKILYKELICFNYFIEWREEASLQPIFAKALLMGTKVNWYGQILQLSKLNFFFYSMNEKNFECIVFFKVSTIIMKKRTFMIVYALWPSKHCYLFITAGHVLVQLYIHIESVTCVINCWCFLQIFPPLPWDCSAFYSSCF